MSLFSKKANTETGSSLISILVYISIFAILAGIAVPRVAELRRSFNRADARQVFESDIRLAKAEAASEGSRLIVSIDNSGESYSLGIDRLPYNTPPAIEELKQIRNLPMDVTITANQTIMFNSQGLLIDSAGTLTTTTATFNDGEDFLTVTVYATGAIEYDTSP